MIIYRKSDLLCVGVVPSGMTIEQEIELNVIPNFGGSSEDYATIETTETNFHLERIGDIVTIVKNVVTPAPPPEPTETELMEQRIRATEDALTQLLLEGMI